MQPVSPVVRGFEEIETTFAKDQPEYKPLPAIRCADGQIITRWKLTWKERLKVLFSGSLFLYVHTFNQPLQPISLGVDEPRITRQ